MGSAVVFKKYCIDNTGAVSRKFPLILEGSMEAGTVLAKS